MMNVCDQKGLEAWRLLVRSEQPVSGENRMAAMRSFLQYKFSPGFDKLEEELRTFEGLLKTYHAIFGEAISDSITKAVIKSQMPAEIRTHVELQTFARTADLVSLMSSLSKRRTAATSSSLAGHGLVPMEIGWVKGKGQGQVKNKEKGKGKGRSKGRGKAKPKSEKFEGWSKAANCWHGKQKQVHHVQSKAGTASSSSSQSTLSATDVGTNGIGLTKSVCEDAERSWIFVVADAAAINQLSMDDAHSLVVDSEAHVHVCPKSCATHATLQALPACWRGLDLRSASGKMLGVWGMREVVRNEMDLHGKVHCENPFVVCEVRRPLLSLAMLEDTGLSKMAARNLEVMFERSICEDRETLILLLSSGADCWNARNRC